jgi:hypothetical protein
MNKMNNETNENLTVETQTETFEPHDDAETGTEKEHEAELEAESESTPEAEHQAESESTPEAEHQADAK